MFKRTTSRFRQVCLFEAIEPRRYLSSTLGASGLLTITGTTGNDTIILTRNNGTLTLNDNGAARSFNSAQVRRVVANLGSGNDNFISGNSVTQSMTVSGGLGNDTLSGGGGNDLLRGEDNDDFIFAGGRGADTVSGGLGTDEVSYGDASGPVNVTLDNVANDGRRGVSFFDTREFDNVMSDVENITGSGYNDYLSASEVPGITHRIKGMVGNDYIVGSDNHDQLFGYYGNDTIIGNNGNDSIWGEAGADLMHGGLGFDDLRYDDTFNQRTTPVTIALPRASATSYATGQGSAGENDRILGFEAVWGTRFNDVIYGNDGDNWLFGMDGDDFLSGLEGSDRLFGGAGNDRLFGGKNNDFLWGEAGADYISGGDDWDDVRYDEAPRTEGVIARLPEWWEYTSIGNGSVGEGDTFANDLEALIGSQFNDRLYGNAQNNYFAALGGNDFILARAGNDTLDGGLGNDYLYGEEDNDLLLGKDGSYTDELWGGSGWDIAERDRSSIIYNIWGPRPADEVYYCEVIR